MSLSHDCFVVSDQCPELYAVLKRIFCSTYNNVRVITRDFRSLNEKNNKNV